MLQGALMHPSDEHLRRDYNKVLRYTGDLSEHTPLSITGGRRDSAQGSQSNRPGTVPELERRLEQRGITTPRGATTQCKVVILELADLTQNQSLPAVISFAAPPDSDAFVQWLQDNELLDIGRFADLTDGGYSRTLMRRAGLVPTGRHLVDASILYFLQGGHVMNDAENLEIRSWLLEPLTEGDTVSTVMRVGSVRVRMIRRHDGRPGGELALRIMTSSGE